MVQSRVSTRHTNGCMAGVGYLLCIGAAIAGGSVFVVVGMALAAGGMAALLVAGVVPVIGLVFVVTLAQHDAEQERGSRPPQLDYHEVIDPVGSGGTRRRRG